MANSPFSFQLEEDRRQDATLLGREFGLVFNGQCRISDCHSRRCKRPCPGHRKSKQTIQINGEFHKKENQDRTARFHEISVLGSAIIPADSGIFSGLARQKK